MSVSIKTAQEIELMRESGHLLEKVHDGLIPYIKPGMSTKEIDRIGEDMIRSMGCIPNFLNYGGFPGSFCISLNDEVVHGIPSEDKIIQDGDLVKIDAGLIYKGYHSDAARTYAVGEVSKEAKQLMDVTRQCFFEGIKFAKAGNHLNDISKAIGAYAAKYRYGIVRDLVGHGIGTHLHEDPQIPNFPQKRRGVKLLPGMTLAIEPMINMGRADVCWPALPFISLTILQPEALRSYIRWNLLFGLLNFDRFHVSVFIILNDFFLFLVLIADRSLIQAPDYLRIGNSLSLGQCATETFVILAPADDCPLGNSHCLCDFFIGSSHSSQRPRPVIVIIWIVFDLSCHALSIYLDSQRKGIQSVATGSCW